MSSSSSSSKKILDALSEIEPLAFCSPITAQARLPPPPSPPQNTPDNPFFSIDLNTSAVPTGPGPCEDMLPDNMFEGDLPKHRAFESNILAASEELVIESLAMMREEARAENTDVLEGEEVRPSQPIFDKTPDLGRYSSFSSSESKIKMAQLLEDLDQLKHEIEELTVRLSSKEAEIAVLKAELLTAQSEGPGSSFVQALAIVSLKRVV